MTPEGSMNTDKLVQDLRIVVSDAEELLRATASQAGDRAAAARAQIEQSLERARAKLAEVEAAVADGTRQMANGADEYVHAHPWNAVGIAAAIGLVVGLLVSRR